MLSIIICSISPERLQAIEANIRQTIDIAYEIIAIDNREKHWPIAKAYNHGARQAQYPYLFFVHEDVCFHANNWGVFIVKKLTEPDCGVIGFAGSKIKLACYSGWYQSNESDVSHMYQRITDGITIFTAQNVYKEKEFNEVITLDGLGLFVRKEVWKDHPFNEALLTGFHCYDVDFTLQIFVAKFKNYVCCSNRCLIEHFSLGQSDKEWHAQTIRIYESWKHLLPVTTADMKLTLKEQQACAMNNTYHFIKRMFKNQCSHSDKKAALKMYWQQPLSWKYFRRGIKLTFKYLLN